jgi:Zn-dependent protease
MFRKSYTLGRIFGIPIYLDSSVIFLLLYFGLFYYRNLLFGLIGCIGLLFSIAAHELGHSLVAMGFGCRVRDITLMMLGGRATLLSMPRKAWQEFLVAIAGPAVSLSLGFGFLYATRLFPVLTSTDLAQELLRDFMLLNISLGIFNLLPAFPMDGGRILRSFLQQFFMSRLKATWVASRIGRFIAVALGLLTIYIWLKGGPFMFILLLITFYIYRAAEQEYQMVLYEERGTTGNPFADIMRNFGFGDHPSSAEPPDEEGTVVVSPPPYERSGKSKIDVHKE